jgi:Na+/proline symporter
MRTVDLLVVAAFLAYIVWDGVRRGRESKDAEGYMLAGRRMRWWAMGLSVMATQASAITLISTTGQGFEHGMRFLHFYLAIPFAMVVLCATVVPWFHRAKVFTAYEYLERRFDRPTRLLASVFFLISRSLAVGSVMYAPSIVLSRGVGIPAWETILVMGVASTIYTSIGGNAAVIVTDAKQMLVMVAGLVSCVVVAWHLLPDGVGFGGALSLAGATSRLDTFHWPSSFADALSDKYNLVSGLFGGFVLFLGYFGADQEQVQRYLAGSSVNQMRQSLLMSAFAKVPMQFVILLLGVLLYVHYLFAPAPVFFRSQELERELDRRPAAEAAPLRDEYAALVHRYDAATKERAAAAESFLAVDDGRWVSDDGRLVEGSEAQHEELRAAAAKELRRHDDEVAKVRDDGMALLARAGVVPPTEKNDADYVFTHFMVRDLPVGIAGLVLAAIFAAAISSLVSPLNSLATSAVMDLWRPLRRGELSQREIVNATRGMTLVWGGLATVSAFYMGGVPIIEKVNRIGSFFYGSMFGVFVLGRLVPRARGAVGWIALASGMATVLAVHWLYNETGLLRPDLPGWPKQIEFLWYNPIGLVAVLLVGYVASRFVAEKPSPAAS